VEDRRSGLANRRVRRQLSVSTGCPDQAVEAETEVGSRAD
jgi:hypothetical protein